MGSGKGPGGNRPLARATTQVSHWASASNAMMHVSNNTTMTIAKVEMVVVVVTRGISSLEI